jgi:tricorn protease-like protein
MSALPYTETGTDTMNPVYLKEGEKADSHDLHTISRITTLGSQAGTVKNFNKDGEIILIPTPSSDPNDPLNWSQAYKWYITVLVVLAAFMVNLTVAGPSLAIISTSME